MQKNWITNLKTVETSRLLSLRTYLVNYMTSPSKRQCAYSQPSEFQIRSRKIVPLLVWASINCIKLLQSHHMNSLVSLSLCSTKLRQQNKHMLKLGHEHFNSNPSQSMLSNHPIILCCIIRAMIHKTRKVNSNSVIVNILICIWLSLCCFLFPWQSMLTNLMFIGTCIILIVE